MPTHTWHPFLATLLLACGSLTAVLVIPSVDAQAEQNCNPPHDGDWEITGTVTCMDRDIYVRTATVRPSASLTLHRVHFTIHNPDNQQQGLIAQGAPTPLQGAKIYIYDSLVDSDGPGSKAIVGSDGHGTLHVVRSTSSVGLSFGSTMADGLLQDSHLIAAGMVVWDGAPRVIGNFIEGVYLLGPGHVSVAFNINNGQPVIENNVVAGCFGSMDFRNSAQPTVRGNTFAPPVADPGTCTSGYGSVEQPPQVIHDNDFLYGAEGFRGDGTNNWWGTPTPDPSLSHPELDMDPWRTSPVHPERLPTASITVSGSVARGAPLTFDGSASQPRQAWQSVGGTELEHYQWSFGNGQTANGKVVQYAFPEPGSFTVELRVIDGKGLTRTTTQTLVVPNQAPSVSVNIQPSAPVAETTLQSQVIGSDPESDSLSYSYAWKRNGVLQEALTDGGVPGDWVHGGDTWQVIVTAQDPYGAKATASRSVTVEAPNQAPTVTSVTLAPAAPRTGDSLTATATGSDPEGQTVSYRYQWLRNGVSVNDLTGATVPGARVMRGDQWTVAVTPFDGTREGEPVSASRTILNVAPSVSSLVIQPSNPVQGQGLKATATTSDPDDATPALSWAWKRNGQLQSDLTGDAVPGSRVATGDSWQVTATTTDSQGASGQDTRSVTVGNRAPAITTLTLTPSNPTRSSTLTATAQTSDPDGQAVSVRYDWLRNGVKQPITESTVSSGLAKGDVWRVIATPNDGMSDGASREATVTIGNTPPTVNQATATPATATVGQTVALHLDAQDPDGDALAATWSLPGGASLTGLDASTSFSTPGTYTVSYSLTDGAAPVTGTLSVTVASATTQTPPPDSTPEDSSGGNSGGDSGGSPDPGSEGGSSDAPASGNTETSEESDASTPSSQATIEEAPIVEEPLPASPESLTGSEDSSLIDDKASGSATTLNVRANTRREETPWWAEEYSIPQNGLLVVLAGLLVAVTLRRR